tara:strand:- start:884 stop:1822 length:939 start_codon:yes stop_codon:yes gene_type:complete
MKDIFKKLIAIKSILDSIYNNPLTKKNKFKSILKFFTFNFSRFLNNKIEVIVPWVENSKFIIGINNIQLRWNVYWGLVECQDMCFLLHALREEDKFIDVGANVGIYTILASKVVGAKSIAFEPVLETVKKFNEQMSINRINHLVSINHKAVGSKVGKIKISNHNDTRNVLNKVLNETNLDKNDVVEVDLTTLDSEIKNDNANYIVKIDVEGYEFEVIQGAEKILSSNKLLALIIENNNMSSEYGVQRETIHNKIISYNLHPVTYNPFTRKITKKLNFKSTLNTIYVNDIAKIENLCLKAKKFKIHTASGIEI